MCECQAIDKELYVLGFNPCADAVVQVSLRTETIKFIHCLNVHNSVVYAVGMALRSAK